jgi:cytochrome c oxidase subunit 1
VVSIHKLRAPGLTWRRLPLFVTSLYASALVQVVATPLLLLAALLLLLEKTCGIGIFDPQLGGDPVLFQHFFWAGLHPMLIAALIAALGVAAEVVSVHVQRAVSRRAFVSAIAVLAITSFFQWGEHSMVAGQSEFASTFFSFSALLGVVPLLVLGLAIVGALRGSSVRLTTPLLFGLGVMCAVALGALSRVPLVATSTGFHLQDSAFSVGQLHASLGGGLTLALMAGFFHWFPKVTGRTYDERLGRLGATASVLGVCLMAVSEFLLGLSGVPRRGASYLAEHQGLELLAGVGGALMVLGLVGALGVLVHGLRVGPRATANPWGGTSLEWSTSSPPPLRNFVATPYVSAGPYAFGEPPLAPSPSPHRG